MSYILDAIKKSEAERNLGVSPGALASSTPVSRARASIHITTVIVLLNVTALGGWWWWQGRVPTPVATAGVAVPSSTEERPSPLSEAVHPTRPPMPERMRERIEQPSPGLVSPSIPVAMAPAPPTPPARLPAFSTHVFADDPQLRAVTLDGRRLTEGDLISPGMRLLEITESGVVLDVNGERVVFDVLQDWRS
jgi:general secretion pathway protein B